MGVTLSGLAFTATVRMVKRIHHHASYRGLDPQPAAFSRFAQDQRFVFDIADLAYGGMTIQAY